MTIKARPNTCEFEENYDNTFKNVHEEAVSERYEIYNNAGKRTAVFYSLEEATEYGKRYSYDSASIKLPSGEVLELK